jgi:hypothetical protein
MGPLNTILLERLSGIALPPAVSVEQANTTLEKSELKSSSPTKLSVPALAKPIPLNHTAIMKFTAVLLSSLSHGRVLQKQNEVIFLAFWAITRIFLHAIYPYRCGEPHPTTFATPSPGRGLG